ncbi:MAG: glycosyltransferase family 39 protein [Chitinophagales bacterium]
MAFLKKYPEFVFYPCWLLLLLWQAMGSSLIPDEAYYWLYARQLDWGYFDHPPAVAILIKVGIWFFSNEIGVRLGFVILSVAGIALMQAISRPIHKCAFFSLMCCAWALQIGGAWAVPDIPLLFFLVLYFFALQQYLEAPGAYSLPLLLLSISGMLYSKYHAVLVLLFTLLAVPKLLKRSGFWLLAVGSLLLYLPHLYWQYTHGFPSFYFHLRDRQQAIYQFQFTIDYLSGQAVLLGLPLFLFVLYKTKQKFSVFERILAVQALGFFLFFLLSSFKNRPEANWCLPALVSIVLLAAIQIDRQQSFPFLKFSGLVSLVLIVLAKLFFTTEIAIGKYGYQGEFHQWKKWCSEIQAAAGERPVVFMNSYGHASLYQFYTGKLSHDHKIPGFRSSQFDIWHYDDSIAGKEVVFFPNTWLEPGIPDTVFTCKGKKPFKIWDYYYPLGKIQTELFADSAFAVTDSLFYFPGKVRNHSAVAGKVLRYLILGKFNFEICWTEKKTGRYFYTKTEVPALHSLIEPRVNFGTIAPHEPGNYDCFVMLRDGHNSPYCSSGRIHVWVRNRF